MKKAKRLIAIMATLMMVFTMTACSSKTTGDAEKKETEKTEATDKVIKVGGTEISKVYYDAMQSEYEKMGYKTEFVLFDSNPVILEACNSGQVDVALGQHAKFVESFNETKGGKLAMVKPYGFYTGIGLYSEKYKKAEEFPDGSTIAIMNDPMNMDIGLRTLQKAGLIKLGEDKGTYSIVDVKENPKNLKIMDMDQAQTVRSLSDMDGALVFFTHMNNAGKDPASYIVRDDVSVNAPMGVIVKKESADKKWATDYASTLRNESVQKTITDKFPKVFTFYKDDSEVKATFK
ncbi:MAG: methionine-binding protein [Clostridioides sp.]|jgi:D-methionine transport system substrate-binding protein|nr:methionine-binding protein [Clostridioides sp.]